MKLLYRLRHYGKMRFPAIVPLPADREAVLPLVPVDVAAKVFHDALFLDSAGADESADKPADKPVAKPVIYGVYNASSLPISEFGPLAVQHFIPSARVTFIPRLPKALLEYQTRFTNIPPLLFDFTTSPLPLANPRFTKTFSSSPVPPFANYSDAFFSGFEHYMKGNGE